MIEKSKIKRGISIFSIVGVCIIVAVLVFGAMKVFKLNSVIVEILGIIAILCLACIFAGPWIDRLEQKKSKIISIVFLSIIGVCLILWIICWIMMMNAIRKDTTLSTVSYNLIRISFIITIQFLVASTISYVLVKYKKTMIPFQIITYVSNLYIDFYFTYLIISLNIIDGTLKFTGNSFIVGNRVMLSLLIIALIYVFISNVVVKANEKRKLDNIINSNNDSETSLKQEISNQSPDERLKKLKKMLDDGLITIDEYESKKSEILKDL